MNDQESIAFMYSILALADIVLTIGIFAYLIAFLAVYINPLFLALFALYVVAVVGKILVWGWIIDKIVTHGW